MTYLVALLEPPRALKFKYPCADGAQITEAVRRICEMIEWDPTEHYENFWETVGDTTPYDADEIAWVDLWDSNLLASLVIGRPHAVIVAAEQFGRLIEEESKPS